MRNIGIAVKPPAKSCNDERCPFHGSLKVRGRALVGKAVSLKAEETAVIEREYLHYVKKHRRYEKRSKRIHSHLPPCIGVKEGDRVMIAECRPLTKSISFVVVEKLGG